MRLPYWSKPLLTLFAALLMCSASSATESLYRKARTLQRNGNHDEAIEAFASYLAQPIDKDKITDHELTLHTEALMQLMNTYQSKGAPEACIEALREGIDNRPSKCAYHLLHVLVQQLLDPIREAWGEPIVVSSGYRCKELNTLIGGVKNSHHMLGCAADIIGGLPLSPSRRGGTSESAGNESESHNVKTNKTLFDFIVKMQQEGRIKFTQLILEGDGRWIHVSYVPGDLRCQVIE